MSRTATKNIHPGSSKARNIPVPNAIIREPIHRFLHWFTHLLPTGVTPPAFIVCTFSSHVSGNRKKQEFLKISEIPVFYIHQMRLEFLQIFCLSACAMSSSLKSGCAREISNSALSHVLLPARFTMPYSVTI